MSLSVRGRLVRSTVLTALAAMAACSHQEFTPLQASNNQLLYQASVDAEKKGQWEKAVKGFETLTFQLPARDPLLPLAYFHLGNAHQHLKEYILAAQAYSRVPENFPEDTLASLGTYRAGQSYASLWRRPDLDADYGTTAMSTFQSFLAAYPDSPLRDSAQFQIDRLNEMFAEKNLMTANLYAKQRAYDSGIIYYRDVVARYPQTKAAKKALIGLVKSYRAIAYRDDAAETCTTLRDKYPGDHDVLVTCGPAPKAVPAAPAAPTPAPLPAKPVAPAPSKP